MELGFMLFVTRGLSDFFYAQFTPCLYAARQPRLAPLTRVIKIKNFQSLPPDDDHADHSQNSFFGALKNHF